MKVHIMLYMYTHTLQHVPARRRPRKSCKKLQVAAFVLKTAQEGCKVSIESPTSSINLCSWAKRLNQIDMPMDRSFPGGLPIGRNSENPRGLST